MNDPIRNKLNRYTCVATESVANVTDDHSHNHKYPLIHILDERVSLINVDDKASSVPHNSLPLS